jgi:hypothetical protein
MAEISPAVKGSGFMDAQPDKANAAQSEVAMTSREEGINMPPFFCNELRKLYCGGEILSRIKKLNFYICAL